MIPIIRNILDKQVLDRNKIPLGKVDGLVLEMREGKPPRVAWIEMGATVVARRLSSRLERWVSRIEKKLGVREGESCRVAWQDVEELGVEVRLKKMAHETCAMEMEDLINRKIILKIPGANHAKE